MPDLLPVRLQDQLRHRKSAVREQQQVIVAVSRKYMLRNAADHGGISYCTLPKE